MKLSPITIAITMAAGVVLTSQFGIATAGITIGIMLALFLVWGIITKKLDLAILVIIASFAVAAVSYVYSVSACSHKTINYINRYATLQGTAISVAEKSETSDNYRYVFKVKSITDRNGEKKTDESIILTTPDKWRCGDSLEIKGIIKDLPKQMNENGFDAAKYYKSQGIFARIYSKDVKRIDKIPVVSPYMLAELVNEKIDSIIYRYYEGDGAALLSAIITGNKHHFSPEYDDILVRTAYKRVLHPAHLHIFIITFFIGLFSGVVHKKYRDIFTIAIFIIYAILQCANIGFVRCLICAALGIYYKIRYGSSFLPDSIAVVVIFCVITMPTILFNGAFVLSIASGMVSWAFIPYTMKKLRRVPKPLRLTSAAMLVFAVVMTPLVAYYFSGLCIYSFFTPFLTAPVVALILVIAPVTLVVQVIFGTAPILGAYLNIAVRFLYKIPIIIEGLPFSYISIAKPSLTFIIMFLCVVFAVYYLIKARRLHVLIYSAAATGLGIALVIMTAMRIGTAEFMFVNVAQGDGSVIHVPFKETVIIDGGGGNAWSDYNSGEALFVPYLEAKGVNHIEAAIVSHYHKDHAEGIISTIRRIKTDYIFAPPVKDEDNEAMKELAEEIRRTAEETGAKLCYITEDTRLIFKSGLTVDIYAHNISAVYDENDTSLPVKIQYGEFSALYTGDMTDSAERRFIARADAEADVLKVAHHGSRNSTCEEFLKAVNPTYSVISCGEDNAYNHPHAQTLLRLKSTAILRTDEMGDIRICARKNGACRIE